MSYEEHNVEQLRKLASARKISGRAEMNREELIAALQTDDANAEPIADLQRRVTRLEQLISGDQPTTTIPQRR
jgi:hypothetical protein